MVTPIEIGRHKVGPGNPCFIIAEAGVNHNGDVDLARRLVVAAADAGADAVKFQTFNAERLASPDAPKAKYQLDATDATESQWAMLKRLELSADAHRELMSLARERRICFLSSPFDEESVDFLDELGLSAFKIPSGEIVNLPYLRHIARSGKPMIVSTGMATLDEVAVAVNAIRETGNPPLALLHCVSNYPARPADVNLRAMDTLAKAFGVPVGYSDHVPDNAVAFAAVARGACIVEKHFTLDHMLPGPDHQASIEPNELAALVRGIRIVESALGDGEKRPTASEADTARVARKSLVASRDLPKGTVLSANMLIAKRPGTGLPPGKLSQVIGRTLCRNVSKDSLLTLEDLQ